MYNKVEPPFSKWKIEKKDIENGNDLSCGQDDWNSKKEPNKECCVARIFDPATGTTTKVTKAADGMEA